MYLCLYKHCNTKNIMYYFIKQLINVITNTVSSSIQYRFFVEIKVEKLTKRKKRNRKGE